MHPQTRPRHLIKQGQTPPKTHHSLVLRKALSLKIFFRQEPKICRHSQDKISKIRKYEGFVHNPVTKDDWPKRLREVNTIQAEKTPNHCLKV